MTSVSTWTCSHTLKYFGMDGEDCTPLRLPMYGEIIRNPDMKLSVADAATFIKSGRLSMHRQGVSPTTKFVVQHIAQHMASPNVGALKAVNDLLMYQLLPQRPHGLWIGATSY